jgi:hypothetical protein
MVTSNWRLLESRVPLPTREFNMAFPQSPFILVTYVVVVVTTTLSTCQGPRIPLSKADTPSLHPRAGRICVRSVLYLYMYRSSNRIIIQLHSAKLRLGEAASGFRAGTFVFLVALTF